MNITDQDIIDTAIKIGIEPAVLKAVALVESNGRGFLPSGKCKILFEGHIFWRQLVIAGINPNIYVLQNKNILFEVRDKSKYIGGEGEYDRLEQAKKINIDCALKSASWGLFQIMGFNFKSCGYSDVKEFTIAMQQSETNQLRAVVSFIGANGMLNSLKAKNWAEFAKKYNGNEYAANQYDIKLLIAYNKSISLNKI
jgi:hypothetical protein